MNIAGCFTWRYTRRRSADRRRLHAGHRNECGRCLVRPDRRGLAVSARTCKRPAAERRGEALLRLEDSPGRRGCLPAAPATAPPAWLRQRRRPKHPPTASRPRPPTTRATINPGIAELRAGIAARRAGIGCCIPAGCRAGAPARGALRYLERNAGSWSDQDRVALAAEVLALIGEPRFAALFGAGSRAEVSIVGRLERPGLPPALVSGQIDRLLVRPDEILIVDYKTNHAPPRSVAQAPAAYVRQLALYRAVLAKLYPERPVRVALLWTETPEMMEIYAPALDARLASIIRGGEHA